MKETKGASCSFTNFWATEGLALVELRSLFHLILCAGILPMRQNMQKWTSKSSLLVADYDLGLILSALFHNCCLHAYCLCKTYKHEHPNLGFTYIVPKAR